MEGIYLYYQHTLPQGTPAPGQTGKGHEPGTEKKIAPQNTKFESLQHVI